jgi:hypothetical protein
LASQPDDQLICEAFYFREAKAIAPKL